MAELQQNFEEILRPEQNHRNNNINMMKKSLNNEEVFGDQNENNTISRNNTH